MQKSEQQKTKNAKKNEQQNQKIKRGRKVAHPPRGGEGRQHHVKGDWKLYTTQRKQHHQKE